MKKLLVVMTLLLSVLLPVSSSAAAPSSCLHGTVICVSKAGHTVKLIKNGSAEISLSARFGSSRTPTHNGTFRVYWKDAQHVSSLYGSAMPYSLFFDGGQAIHFSSDFARVGYAGASHGCVNLRSLSGARSLYNSVSTGTKVVVY